MPYLLDSDVVSEARKRSPHPEAAAWLAAIPVHDAYLSVITVGELEAGVLAKERVDRAQGLVLRRWLDGEVLPRFAGRILPVTTQVAKAEARMQVPDRRPKADALIAATAAVAGLVVATRNVKDFKPMGIRVVNPWDVS